jgi:hypothetical protein
MAPAAVCDSSHGHPNGRCGQTSNVCEVAHPLTRFGLDIPGMMAPRSHGRSNASWRDLICRGGLCSILLAACRAAPAFNSPCRRSQTLRRDAALVSRPEEKATRPRVLLWVKGRNPGAIGARLLWPQKRTTHRRWLGPGRGDDVMRYGWRGTVEGWRSLRNRSPRYCGACWRVRGPRDRTY